MRGPGYKITGDVRRTWRCSLCGSERKRTGEVTSMQCTCNDQPWMQLVTERTNVPRPIQRPSDIERHPIDFGIAPPPPAPPKPEATIIKSALAMEVEVTIEVQQVPAEPEKPLPDQTVNEPQKEHLPEEESTDDWGEGIL